MSYSSNTKLHATLDESLFINEVDGLPATQTGTPTIVDSQFGSGWEMSATTTANFAITGPSGAFTLGFWLKPKNPGLVTHGTSTESLTQALISKCGFSTVGITTSATNLSILIYERTLVNNQNVMVVQLGGVNGISVPTASTTTSSAYDADTYHYFWIVFNGASSPSLKIYTDLTLDTAAATTGTVPTTLTSNSNDFAINENAPGYSYNLVRNTGTIDDVILFDTAITTAATIARAANLGAKYIGDTTFTSVEEIDFPILFNDDSTVEINSVYANRGTVYVSRSDGKLMRGVKSVWQSRRDFNNSQELDHVVVYSRGTSSPSISAGAIVLENEVIRV